ncbi:acyltransferase [Alicyclobacillus sp. SO9]|uniref:acyltransferase family protein n=1 Tax=Alicyclobacillus sp. SO9 TaxID=2665646 RepID=UPI0018E8F572|nr:acyltransferase [Alicyclobacillus sp. SO9]QQE79285.1 acyltransferase [Alicyclobacillus sp. SO9]
MASHVRYNQLDSLRGIAALTVVAEHCMNTLGKAPVKNWFAHFSPLHVLISGHQAVILFFLLSGFVLSLPYYQGRIYTYTEFITKRVFRLYIPYIIALAFGLMMRVIFVHHSIDGLWGGHIGPKIILQELFMLDQFNQNYVDPVVWSLVQEMRISLIFPLLILFLSRYRWKTVIVTGFAVSCIGIYVHLLFRSHVNVFTNYPDTLHYIIIFIMGAVLAKHKDTLVAYLRRTPKTAKWSLGITALLLYTYTQSLLSQHWALGLGLTGRLMSDWITALSASVFILLAISEPGVKRALSVRPLVFIGKISFSIYLFHLIILLSLISLFPHLHVLDVAGTFLLTIGLATAGYYYVERPSIRIGKIVVQRL